MASNIRDLYLAVTTENRRHSGTKNTIVLIVTYDGIDRLHHTLGDPNQRELNEGETKLFSMNLDLPHGTTKYGRIDPDRLTNSSIRIGIRGRDRWRPEKILIWGIDWDGNWVPLGYEPEVVFPYESGIDCGFLSIDPNDDSVYDPTLEYPFPGSRISMPVRLLKAGNNKTLIKSINLIVTTKNEKYSGTASPIYFKIIDNNGVVVDWQIPDSPQHGQDKGQTFLHKVPIYRPFRQVDIKEMYLEIAGMDLWKVESVFVFGFADSTTGHSCVNLVHSPSLDARLSTDKSEGEPRLNLLK